MSAHKALNRLAKWRAVFAGWQLGTRASDDPECQAVRDHREVSLLLRAEVSTLLALLVKKGVFTVDEFTTALGDEADMLEADLQRRFPGIASTDEGMAYDARARETMKGWKP
jgi:hypothetical protein